MHRVFFLSAILIFSPGIVHQKAWRLSGLHSKHTTSVTAPFHSQLLGKKAAPLCHCSGNGKVSIPAFDYLNLNTTIFGKITRI